MKKFEVYEVTIMFPKIPSHKVCMSVEAYNGFLEALRLKAKEFSWLNPLFMDEFEAQRKNEKENRIISIGELSYCFNTVDLDKTFAFSAELKTFFKVSQKTKDSDITP